MTRAIVFEIAHACLQFLDLDPAHAPAVVEAATAIRSSPAGRNAWKDCVAMAVLRMCIAGDLPVRTRREIAAAANIKVESLVKCCKDEPYPRSWGIYEAVRLLLRAMPSSDSQITQVVRNATYLLLETLGDECLVWDLATYKPEALVLGSLLDALRESRVLGVAPTADYFLSLGFAVSERGKRADDVLRRVLHDLHRAPTRAFAARHAK